MPGIATKQVRRKTRASTRPPVRTQAPVHPGEILDTEFLEPLGLTQYRVAVDIGVPPRRINEIVLGKRAISADTALRLSDYFGNSAEFWMNLQMRYDLERERDRRDGLTR
jgi:addiction module HigA family antidote